MSKEIFKNNPNLQEAFVTSDGNPFYSKNAAENHAKTLEDKTVKHLENPSKKVVVIDEDTEIVKLTPKKQAQADYTAKFEEVPAEEFTKNQLLEAIEKGEKLVAELKND